MKNSVLESDLSSVAASVVESGVGLINFPVESLVQPVVAGWLKFLRKSQDEKDLWTFTDLNNPDDPGAKFDGADDGYVPRKPEEKRADGVDYDIKEFFHFKKGLRRFLAEAGTDTSAETEWLCHMETLHAECVRQYLDVTAALEPYYPECNFLERARKAVEEGTPALRLICYKQAVDVGENIGKMHNDRDWLTLHLQDSNPGLVYTVGGQQVEYVKQPGKVLVFPGKKARKMTNNLLPSLPHGVIAHLDTIGKRRWTIVFFGHNDVRLTQAERDAY
jgi:hypothetical protein